MSKSSLVSVIVATYNWPTALAMVLKSLLDQKDRHFEIIIADDGSKDETRDLIARFARQSDIPVKHFWQEDRGFRLSEVRNGALKLAQGDLTIFIDGDCCVMPDFIAVWLPLILATFMKPAVSPISAPPGKHSSGID